MIDGEDREGGEHAGHEERGGAFDGAPDGQRVGTPASPDERRHRIADAQHRQRRELPRPRREQREDDQRGGVPGGGVHPVAFVRMRDGAEEPHQRDVDARADAPRQLHRPRRASERARHREQPPARWQERDAGETGRRRADVKHAPAVVRRAKRAAERIGPRHRAARGDERLVLGVHLPDERGPPSPRRLRRQRALHRRGERLQALTYAGPRSHLERDGGRTHVVDRAANARPQLFGPLGAPGRRVGVAQNLAHTLPRTIGRHEEGRVHPR